MLIRSARYLEHGYVKGLLVLIKVVFFKVTSLLKNPLSVLRGSSALPLSARTFEKGYPALIAGGVENLKCISCLLCEDICPVKCIAIKSSNIKEHSLNYGTQPDSFEINMELCTRCGYCEDVCPVDAIELNGKYSLLDFENPIFDKERLIKTVQTEGKI